MSGPSVVGAGSVVSGAGGDDLEGTAAAAPSSTVAVPTAVKPGPSSNIPLVDLQSMHQPLMAELTDAFTRVVTQSAFIGGREVERFEAELAEYIGVKHAVGVASGTAALHLALRAVGIGQGDEVIVPANTFFATAEAVLAVGARPVLVDVDERTALLDPSAVEAAVNDQTAAIVPVHLYGQPVDLGAIMAIAQRHGLYVVDDAAQAIGARWDGRSIGTVGHATAFSFYPGKNLGALGDAGAVVTNDPAIARKVTALRSHGEIDKHHHEMAGFTERLDGLQAAFLSVKLPRLEEWQAQRDNAVARYRSLLEAVPAARMFDIHPRVRHVHHLFVVQVPHRDSVHDQLRKQGIGVGIHYPTPLHLLPAWRPSGQAGTHPVAEGLAQRILSLPLFPGMSDDQIDTTVAALVEALKRRAK